MPKPLKRQGPCRRGLRSISPEVEFISIPLNPCLSWRNLVDVEFTSFDVSFGQNYSPVNLAPGCRLTLQCGSCSAMDLAPSLLSGCLSSEVARSWGWVGVAADFWAFDSMRPLPQPIPSLPHLLLRRLPAAQIQPIHTTRNTRLRAAITA